MCECVNVCVCEVCGCFKNDDEVNKDNDDNEEDNNDVQH